VYPFFDPCSSPPRPASQIESSVGSIPPPSYREPAASRISCLEEVLSSCGLRAISPRSEAIPSRGKVEASCSSCFCFTCSVSPRKHVDVRISVPKRVSRTMRDAFNEWRLEEEAQAIPKRASPMAAGSLWRIRALKNHRAGKRSDNNQPEKSPLSSRSFLFVPRSPGHPGEISQFEFIRTKGHPATPKLRERRPRRLRSRKIERSVSKSDPPLPSPTRGGGENSQGDRGERSRIGSETNRRRVARRETR